MAFNFNDTIVTVASKDGFLQKYDLTKFQKTPESVIDKKCNFKHCIFVQGDDQEEKLYTVGGWNNQMMVRCYDGKDNLDPSMPNDFS